MSTPPNRRQTSDVDGESADRRRSRRNRGADVSAGSTRRSASRRRRATATGASAVGATSAGRRTKRRPTSTGGRSKGVVRRRTDEASQTARSNTGRHHARRVTAPAVDAPGHTGQMAQGTGEMRRISNRSKQVMAKAHAKAGGVKATVKSSRTPLGTRLVYALVAVLAVVAVVVAVRACVGRAASSSGDRAQVARGTVVSVEIPEGYSSTQIADLLYEKGVVDSVSSFKKEVTSQDAESQLKPGVYELVAGADVASVVKLLTVGPNSAETSVTIPEGLTLQQTAKILEDVLEIPADSFTKQAKASNYASDYAFLSAAAKNSTYDTLEGYLCPKTYDFTGIDKTADAAIRLMLDQYETETSGVGFSAGEKKISTTYGVTMSDHDIITLASVIEKEALTDKDRTLIASVFYNRLSPSKGSGVMRLQSDATMGYVLGRTPTADDLETESPYNTYLNDGLPPTPICTPSQASIEAALSPADTNYFYFYITGEDDGNIHAYSETYEEHQKVIADHLGIEWVPETEESSDEGTDDSGEGTDEVVDTGEETYDEEGEG